jgi:hypothetical protein
MLFWVVTPCRLVGRYQRFGETRCLHLQMEHHNYHLRENRKSHTGAVYTHLPVPYSSRQNKIALFQKLYKVTTDRFLGPAAMFSYCHFRSRISECSYSIENYMQHIWVVDNSVWRTWKYTLLYLQVVFGNFSNGTCNLKCTEALWYCSY